MADLDNDRILDESKIEDDDMVEIVFQLLPQINNAMQNSSSISVTQSTEINSISGQKRQFSFDQTEPCLLTSKSTDTDNVGLQTNLSQTSQIQKTTFSRNNETTTQIQSSQKTVQISEPKSVTIQRDGSNTDVSNGHAYRQRQKKKTRSKSDLGLFNFKMFKPQGSQVTSELRQSGDGTEKPDPPVSQLENKLEIINPRKCFVHYDSQSIMADYSENGVSPSESNSFANLKSGAATANIEDCVESDPDSLLLQTPKFINEFYEEPVLKGCSPGSSTLKHCPKHRIVVFEGTSSNRPPHGTSNRDKLLASINLSDHTLDRRFLNFEHMDHGANYYRRHFIDHDHVNYFGVSEAHGPLAISMQREKTDSGSERGEANYQYRLIIRSAQVPTLRGSILEEFLPNPRGGSNKVHFRDILECIAPQIKQETLKLAENKHVVVDELLKFDEISTNVTYKIGLVYCKAAQKTEEEMYNNDVGSAAFDEFMETIGEKVSLKGFDSFRAGLDNKSDTTGTHSLYTRYNNCQLMFHVSTLLPYTENDRQQVVRKRHIGNDIVTVIFQEADSEPFTPAHFRSHYQHVFVVVRVSDPGTPQTTYQIAVTRSEEVPEFGPPIPEERMKKGAAFRHFLLTKLINAENASLKAKKLALMAKRTREQLLTSSCDTLCTTTSMAPVQKKGANPGKLGRSLSFKRKARFAPRLAPEVVSRGALKWNVSVVDEGVEKPCYLAISPNQIVIVEQKTKFMMYMLPCKAVLGWTSTPDSLKLYYDTGEVIVIKRGTVTPDDNTAGDVDDIVKRLTCTSDGCETQEITVIKNQQGKLGFHIQFQGIVGDVTEHGPAWAAGLRPSSRLLEVRGVLVANLEHEQLITQLKGKDSIVVVALPPYPDGQPRRSISQLQSPTDARSKAASISTTRPTLEASPGRAAEKCAVQRSTSLDSPSPSTEHAELGDTVAPLANSIPAVERPSSRESNRIMTRGSMIALNLLEQELGIDPIDDSQKIDLDDFLESIVGKDNYKELNDEVKSLEARSSCSSRPQTPSLYTSQQSLNSEDLSPTTRHSSFVLSPTTARRTEMHPSRKLPPRGTKRSEIATTRATSRSEITPSRKMSSGIPTQPDSAVAKRCALGSDNLNPDKISQSVGKRFALGSDTLDSAPSPRSSTRSVIGAERYNGHTRSRENYDIPDITEIFEMIDKTRLDSESNIRSPSYDISEIDAVVSMIEKVLESTDSYLQEEVSTRGLSSDSNYVVADTGGSRSIAAAPGSTSPYTSLRNPRSRSAAAGSETPPGRQSPNRTVTGSPFNSKVENIQRKIADYNDDMTRAIEQLDSIKLGDTARRRTSLSSSSVSDEGSPQVVTSDSVNINTESEQSTSDEDFPQKHYTMRRMRREGLLMEPPSDASDQSRASDDIPPSPLQMLMERAREAQLDQNTENDNSWVRTTLLRIAELEAALEQSNFELQALRKQNREMEQTLEIVDEENAKIRREMDRTNSQLSTFTTWVQSKQLL